MFFKIVEGGIYKGAFLLISFFSMILVAKNLGATINGFYTASLVMSLVLSQISRFGGENRALKESAEASVRGIYYEINKGTYIFALLIYLLFFLFFLINNQYALNTYAFKFNEVNVYMFIASIFHAFSVLRAHFVQGKGYWRMSIIIQGMPPAFPLAACIFFNEINIQLVSVSYLTGCIFALIISYITSKELFTKNKTDNGNVKKTTNIKLPINDIVQIKYFLVSMIAFIQIKIYVFILTFYNMANEVSYFNITERLTSLIAFSLVISNSIFIKKISNLFNNKMIKDLELLVGKSIFITFFISLFIFAFIWFFYDYILDYANLNYKNSIIGILILALAQLISVSCGPVGYILMLSNNIGIYLNISLTSFIMGLIIFFILYKYILLSALFSVFFGAAFSLIFQNIMSFLYIRLALKIRFKIIQI